MKKYDVPKLSFLTLNVCDAITASSVTLSAHNDCEYVDWNDIKSGLTQ